MDFKMALSIAYESLLENIYLLPHDDLRLKILEEARTVILEEL